jgi:hypothetical protein
MGQTARRLAQFPLFAELASLPWDGYCNFHWLISDELKNIIWCPGVILLDLEEKDLPGVAFRVVEQMAKEDLVEVESKAALMRALLLRHRPVAHHHDRFRFGVVRRNAASYTSLQVMETV